MELQPKDMQGIDEKLVLQFLYTFSRFEYALKRSRYHGPDGNVAHADWDRFENDLGVLPLADLAPVLACGNYILAKPPKKQVVKGGGLSWEDSAPTASEIKSLLVYVCRIRNNLFHGGKFLEGAVHDAARDKDLLCGGLSVLNALLHVPGLPAAIKHYFEEEG